MGLISQKWVNLTKTLLQAHRMGFQMIAPDGLIKTGRNHGNEMMDETAIQLRLDRAINPGWQPSWPSLYKIFFLKTLMAITELYTLYGHEYHLKNELWYREVIYRHQGQIEKIDFKI